MKITKIEIKNFKAFRRPDVIDLGENGQNLLLYGENGSGKTSLYEALKFFLESSEDESIKFDRNIFINDETDKGYIKLHFTPDPKLNKDNYEWSEDVEDVQEHTLVRPIIDASKAKGFLDYKDLLKTNYLHHEKNDVNVFDLLINTLLKNVVNDQTVPTRSFFDQWSDILDVSSSVQEATQEIEDMEGEINSFNIGLANQLVELQTRASEILRKFGYKDTVVALDFGFQGIEYNREDRTLNYQNIPLKVKFLDKDLTAHHRFLNEAKLSAIALSIFLAGFQLQPSSDLKLLVIDDALIGLDMSNRLPLFRILKDYFSDYQIFLMTYDKAWYEIIKQQTEDDNKEWKYIELYCGEIDGCEVPVYVENKTYLEKAREYFDANDYKACAVYLRTAFEEIIKRFCNKRKLPVKYCRNPKKTKIPYLWKPIKNKTKKCVVFPNNDIPLVCPKIVDAIEVAQDFMLNELCHATLVNIHKRELKDALKAVERLEVVLRDKPKPYQSNSQ